MKKNIFALVLALVMVFSMALSVSAAEPADTAALVLDVGNGKGTVTVDVYLQGGTGITNGKFAVTYDASVLMLVEVLTSDAYAVSSVNDQDAGTVSLAWVGSDLQAEKTLMLTLKLEFAEGSTETVTYTAENGGCFTDTEAVEVLNDSVTVSFGEPVGVDTTELEKAIEKAEALDEDLYTEESFDAVEKALEDAKAVLADASSTQEEVDAATKALNDAMAGLKKADGAADTGDNSHMWLWVAVLAVSLMGLVVLVVSMIRSGKAQKATRVLSILLVTAMLMTMIPINSLAIVVGEDGLGTDKILANIEDIFDGNSYAIRGEEDTFAGAVKQVFDKIFDLKTNDTLDTNANLYADDEIVRILVELEDDCLLEMGYTQNQISQGESRVKADTARLKAQQSAMAHRIEALALSSELGKTFVKYNYTAALNGLAMSVPYGILAEINALDGVKRAVVCSEYCAPETDTAAQVADPSMFATGSSFGTIQTWETLGYTGQGMTVAVLDTGLDIDHPSFVDAPEGARLTLADIEAVLTELNAYHLFTQTSAIPLEAEDLYYNEKVPYGFNYVDCGLDITHDYDQQGDHGSHVAGTVAANRLDSTPVVGVAPDAQIIVMKLFGQNGGAFADDILAAIEDSILLNIDVINMSLGSPAGFTEDHVLIQEIFGRILDNDILLAVAAGNSASSAAGNALGTNLNYTSDPDNGLVTSPGTYISCTTVASVENTHVMMNYFLLGEEKIPFVDVNFTFFSLEGTMEYVVIPGYGRTEDYAGLDLTGKIALVSRGGGDEVTFVVKQENAFKAGAAGLIVYDNVDGNYISMYDGGFLPNVFITKASGTKLLEAAVDGVGTIEVLPITAETGVPSKNAGLMSDFSCWGVTPDLQLMPDVTAPGGNIYSCTQDGTYGTMSGTSMACPHIAGMGALVLQYLHDVYPNLTDAQYHTIVESLIMCTAEPLLDPDGILYSPRKQGSGSANIYQAITSPVYLTSLQKATGELTPKASMGDDPERTGEFSFTFDMHNLTGTAQSYVLEGMMLTDQYTEFLELPGLEFMGETGRNLTGDVTFEIIATNLPAQYDFNRDGRTDLEDVQYMLDACNGLEEMVAAMDLTGDALVNTMDAQALYLLLQQELENTTRVTVPANGTVTVKVSMKLSEEDKAYMDAHYENGIYVDGFVRAYAEGEDGVDLSLPFMGFYGGWHEAPVFDTGWYYEDEETIEYNRYMNVIFATLGGGTSYTGLGMNPYLAEDPYTPEHNVLSPNGDNYYDYVPEIYISMMRSAEILDFTWTDDITGEELFYEYYAYARKSYYWPAYGMAMPLVYGDGGLKPFTMYDEKGNLMVEDLQHLTLTIRAYLDDGDLDNVPVNEKGQPVPDHAWADDIIEVPVVIDLKAPTMDMDTLRYYTEDGRNYVTFRIEDNYDVAAVVTTTQGGGAYDYLHVNEKVEGVDGESATITLDITDYDATFQVVLCDYGCNETYYELVNVGNAGLNEDEFYAFRRYSTVTYQDSIAATDAYNGWQSFYAADKMLNHTSQSESGEATVFAAEYVDGYIFGAQGGSQGYNSLFVMKAGSWDRVPFGSDRAMNQTVYEWPGRSETYFPLKMLALDMAYDYTTDTMYMLANALENEYYFPEGEVNILLSLDLQTGKVTILGKIFPETVEPFLALTLACDNDGVLYTINYENGKLYTIDKTPAETTPEFGFGSYVATCVSQEDAKYMPASYTQSMTVDHETNTLYWAAYQGKVGQAAFIELDKTNGSIVGMTYTENNGELCGLFKPYDSGRDIIPAAELTGITLRDSGLYLRVGDATSLFAVAQPFNAALGTVTWSSADESIATVNEHGIVVATGMGKTTVTATCNGFTAECTVNVSDVDGTVFAHSGDYWLLLDAGRPGNANQVADAMELDGTVTAAAFRDNFLYAAAVTESFDADYNTIYKTNLYKLDARTLHGELLASYDGKTTALAFNYADGFLYGLTMEETTDANWNWSLRYNLIRINMSTGATLPVTDLDAIYPCSDHLGAYTTCSGALAIDYEGNFYTNGDDEDGGYTLTRFDLSTNGEIINATVFTGFEACNGNGDAMVWSERNNGLLYTNGDMLRWVDVSDMNHVETIDLGQIRGSAGTVLALAIPLSNEPDVPAAVPAEVILDAVYTVAQGETIKIVPTLNPWNAAGNFTFSIADTSIAKVDEKGVVTGQAIGQTTLTVTETASGLSATTTIDVTKNPGYLYGYLQSNLVQGVPLESWARLPLSNVADFAWMHENAYDLTIYAAAYYDGLVYAVGQHNLGGYYALTINPSNFTYNIVREMDMMVRGMAFDYTTGTLYAIASTDAVTGGLFQVDPATMEMTLVNDNDIGALLVAMAIDESGTIYVADDYGELFTMDKHTGELWSTGISARTSPYLQSMTYDYNNDQLYWAVGGQVYTVDPQAGVLSSIGNTECVISGLFSVPLYKIQIPEVVDPAGVVMNEKDTVAVGHTLAIDAVVLPISVSTVDQTLYWSSSDASVATVDENGVITGVSVGVAEITATDAKGNSDTITITVTAQPRSFYGYDELSQSWVRFGTDGKILDTWADAEGLSPIVAAQYIDGVLYAYDEDGFFYTIDTETFARTFMGNGINGLTTSLEAWDHSHNEQIYYVDGIPYQMIDMTYSTITGRWGNTVTTMYGVMMAYHVSDWRDSFSYRVVELDMTTGEIVSEIMVDELVDGMSLRPTNLIYRGEYLWTINGYITGMITQIDPFFGTATGTAICPEYWGDFNGGRSMIEDPLTGVVYAIRDMRTDYIGMPDYNDNVAASVLCTISLSVGSTEEICTIGSNMRITGMFIK